MRTKFYFPLVVLFLLSCATTKQKALIERAALVDLAVATSEPQASHVALEIRSRGGNLADVAVATSFAISVIRPQSTGIGGGGFLIYYNAKLKKAEAWDFRETAPSRARAKHFLNTEGKPDEALSQSGARAVAVPGLVAGLFDFHRAHGKLSWPQVIEPAIQIAEKGAIASEHLVRALQSEKEELLKDPEISALFYPRGRALKAGDTFVQTNLAQTLRGIAAGGKDYFYKNEFASKLSLWMGEHKGLMHQMDLLNYRTKKRSVVREKWRDFEILTMPPPSSGGIHLVQILKMADEVQSAFFKVSNERDSSGRSLKQIVVDIESFKRAYADRALHLGDSDFSPVPMKQLLDTRYLKRRARQIEKGKILPAEEISPWSREYLGKKQTTHMSFMDAEGSAISTTQTINGLFGAQMILPTTGVVLNNEMDDFSIAEGAANLYGLVGGKANKIEGGKRPLSSMTPTIILDAKTRAVRLVVGAPGGSRIITQVYEVISRILRDRVSPEEALGACRYHHQWSPDKVFVEERCAKEFGPLKDFYSLETKGSFGEVQVVGRDLRTNEIYSATDPRGQGIPAIKVRLP